MLDHVTIQVRDIARARAFYDVALAPLGLAVLMSGEGYHGYGIAGADRPPGFWIGAGGPVAPVHIAFAARDRWEVEAFHKAALAAGGTDNGAPGLRPHYEPGYYAAFVLDPDGHNIEAVVRERTVP